MLHSFCTPIIFFSQKSQHGTAALEASVSFSLFIASNARIGPIHRTNVNKQKISLESCETGIACAFSSSFFFLFIILFVGKTNHARHCYSIKLPVTAVEISGHQAQCQEAERLTDLVSQRRLVSCLSQLVAAFICL